MFARRPPGSGSPAGIGLQRGPVAKDLVVLLAMVFVTFSMQFFATTAGVVELLRLTPMVWQAGFVWQLGTYAFAGYGASNLWFVLEMAILFFFARDVLSRLGRKNFWRVVAWGVLTASLVGGAVQMLSSLWPSLAGPLPFVLLQGQRTLLVITIAAFATIYQRATINLFFVLPIEARWFLGIELLFAFMGFLATRDLAGFLGIVGAVGITYNILSAGGLRRAGHEVSLRLQQQRIRNKMKQMRRRSDLRAVKDEEPKKRDPWVH